MLEYKALTFMNFLKLQKWKENENPFRKKFIFSFKIIFSETFYFFFNFSKYHSILLHIIPNNNQLDKFHLLSFRINLDCILILSPKPSPKKEKNEKRISLLPFVFMYIFIPLIF